MNEQKKFFTYGLETLDDTGHIKDHFYICNYFEKYAIRVDSPEQADYILVTGGDGKMLEAIGKFWQFGKPFFGLNYGHIGFLLNEPNKPTNAISELCRDKVTIIESKLLEIWLRKKNLDIIAQHHAFNDFVIERTQPQSAKINVTIDEDEYFSPLTCDGIIVSTAAGSTGYNGSAGGVIVPINTNSLVLTGISPAVFENWRSSQLSETSQIVLTPVERAKRPVRFIADGNQLEDCHNVLIKVSEQHTVRLAFLNSQAFQKKVLRLQFNR